MNKRGLLVLVLISVFMINLVYAQTDPVDKSYQCLKDQLKDNCGNTKNIDQLSFNLLAISYDSNLQSTCKSLLNTKKTNDCWGSTDGATCNIKSTSLAVLSLININSDVKSSLDWIKTKEKTSTGLTWYLEIDTKNASQCDINGAKFTIQDNQKITGSNPAGLVKGYSDYWFEIKDTSKNYTISCDRDFVSTLVYQKPGSTYYYVSSETHSAPAFDSTTEKVESSCFANSGSCDYESTLWAAFALAKSGESIDKYLPYITALADNSENKKYLPSAFLYILTKNDDYYNDLLSLQKNGNFWDESGKRLYDTPIALLALQPIGLNEVENSKKYLLSIAQPSGCWTENTGLILYSGWPKGSTSSGGNGNGTGSSGCVEFGHYCTTIGACASGDTLNNFYCPSLSNVCCLQKPVEQTCAEKSGKICSTSEQCSGSEAIASDTNYCCLSDCAPVGQTTNACEQAGYFCKTQCSGSQTEQSSYSSSCTSGQVCCKEAPTTSGSNYWLIVLLIILIVLVVLAIIFRNQLKIWWFKIKSKYRTGKPPAQTGRPGPPRSPPFPMMRRILPRQQPPQMPVRRNTDKDFDETMKRLRDMSK